MLSDLRLKHRGFGVFSRELITTILPGSSLRTIPNMIQSPNITTPVSVSLIWHSNTKRVSAGIRKVISGEDRQRSEDRAKGLDARCLSKYSHPSDQPARAQRNRRHAAGRELDNTCPEFEAQGHSNGKGAGRGRPRTLPLFRRGNLRSYTRANDQ